MAKSKSRHAKGLSSGSFGAEAEFRCPDLRTDLLVSKMHEFIMAVARRIEGEPHALLGHAKMFVQTDGGFLKLSVVDTGLGVESINELKTERLSGGSIRIMAVAIGVRDATIRDIVEDEVFRLSPVILCEILEHGHDHGHNHCGHQHHHEHELTRGAQEPGNRRALIRWGPDQ